LPKCRCGECRIAWAFADFVRRAGLRRLGLRAEPLLTDFVHILIC
jgi:hypothetical protein